MQFEALPNEVILHVFSYLKMMELIKCGHVSKRFRAISNDDNLWPKSLNLLRRKVGLLAGDEGLKQIIIITNTSSHVFYPFPKRKQRSGSL